MSAVYGKGGVDWYVAVGPSDRLPPVGGEMADLLKVILALALVPPAIDQPVSRIGYAFTLTSVVRQIGDQQVPLTTISPAGYSADDQFTIKWVPAAGDGIYVWVINRTAMAAEIDWGAGSYQGPDGDRQGLVHRGTGWGAPGQSQAPTLLAPGAKWADLLVPERHLVTAPGTDGGSVPQVRALLPIRVPVGREGETVTALKGGSFRATLGLRQGQALRCYVATFAIADVTAVGPATASPAAAPLPSATPTPLPTPSPTPSATPRPRPSRRADVINTRREFRKDSR